MFIATALPASGGQSRVVVRVLGDFADVLHVRQLAFAIDDEDGSSQAAIQWASADQHAVRLTESRAAMSAECLNGLGTLGPAPSLLSERQIHAHDENFDVVHRAGGIVEFLRFLVADGCVERRNRADDPRLASTACQGDIAQPIVLKGKIGSRVANTQGRPGQIDRISFERHRSASNVRHDCFLKGCVSEFRARANAEAFRFSRQTSSRRIAGEDRNSLLNPLLLALQAS